MKYEFYRASSPIKYIQLFLARDLEPQTYCEALYPYSIAVYSELINKVAPPILKSQCCVLQEILIFATSPIVNPE